MAEDSTMQFSCPVCFEIPVNEIFQCVNGHTICPLCLDKLAECPQCRLPYGNEKIRNRALEDILNNQKFECYNKSFGCTSTMVRSELPKHMQNCSSGPKAIPLCHSMGYNCGYRTNSGNVRGAVEHFEQKHEAVKFSSNIGKILLVDFPVTQLHKSSVWTPHIFQNADSQFLFFVKMNGAQQTVSLICISLESWSHKTEMHTVKFAVCSNEQPKLEWSAVPVGLEDAAAFIMEPLIQIPGSILKTKYLVDGSLQIVVEVVCSDNGASGNADLAKSLESSFAFNELPVDPAFSARISSAALSTENDSRSTSNGIVCDACQVKSPKGTWYHCLQCKDYNLCDRCWRGKDHAYHFFAAIRNDLEHVALGKLKWDCVAQDRKPLVTKDVIIEGPLRCIECEAIGIRRGAKYACLICTTLYSLCSSCYNQKRAICQTHNFFTLLNSN